MPRVGLDRHSIVQAAADLADREGLENVTLVRLASDLGVSPAALFHHFDGLADLRQELSILGLRMLSAQLGEAAIGKASDDALLAICRAYRAWGHRHAGLYAAIVRPTDKTDPRRKAAIDQLNVVLRAALSGYGIEGRAFTHVIRGLRAMIHGFVSFESAGLWDSSLSLDESYELLIRAFQRGIRQMVEDSAIVDPIA
ncbi:MAG: TetR/AcrR family transcriptional regulator [Dehalococcoidia bacterium]|nr:TetR/AcrR family transcriptional regulator [Dehalococcoidia bacterium]